MLAASEWELVDLVVPEWEEASVAAGVLLVAEAWVSNGELLARHPDKIGEDVSSRLLLGHDVEANLAASRVVQHNWQARLDVLFDQVDFLATPTLSIFPPGFDEADDLLFARCTLPVNLAGVPALCMPVPTGGPLPTSIQLIGPAGAEERLLAAGSTLEAAAKTL